MTKTLLKFASLAGLAVVVAAVPATAHEDVDNSWTETEFRGDAISWGGKLRAGPGMEFEQIGSLWQGAPVKLLTRTDREWLDLPWYKIRLSDGRIAYMAGGLLCSRGPNEIEGLYNANDCR